MDLNKFTSAGTLRLVTKATLKAADFSLMIGRLDFSQFLPGVALCRNITPTKLSQPNNIKLLKSKIVKITRDIIGITLQCRVYARTHAKDAAVRRMDCERDESLDGDCMLERCRICPFLFSFRVSSGFRTRLWLDFSYPSYCVGNFGSP